MDPRVQSCTHAHPGQVWFAVLAWVEESSQAPSQLRLALTPSCPMAPRRIFGPSGPEALDSSQPQKGFCRESQRVGARLLPQTTAVPTLKRSMKAAGS